MNTVTQQVTDALAEYRYADAARVLYDFAWDEFCSFYVEMVKSRLQDPAQRTTSQRVLAYTLDVLLRLLHPMIPFITEEVWQLLGRAAPERGLTDLEQPAESIMIAAWPESDPARRNVQVEASFARFQELLGGLRDIRSRQNIPPKTLLRFSVRCEKSTADLLEPMDPYFESMAGAKATAWGPEVQAPATSASFIASGAEVFVDLAEHIDIDAEIARKTKEVAKLEAGIAAKERQLANTNFVERAPADVIGKERAALDALKDLLTATQATLIALQKAWK